MRLEEISEEHEGAFLAMLEDYKKNDPETYARHYKRAKWNEAEFKKFVKECEKDRLDWRPKAGKVSVTRYVLVDEQGRICASGVLRFPLTKETEKFGGNVEYDVPPSRRKEGNGWKFLALVAYEAVRAGMARILLTHKAGDVAAQKSIEKNGGELEETKDGVSRYWLRLR